MQFVFSDKKIIFFLGILFLFVAVPRIIFPDIDHGDDWADAEYLMAARNFVKFGFVTCHFLPILAPQTEMGEVAPYTHYPPLGLIWDGFLMKLFRCESLYPLRAMALLLSFLNLMFWYLFIKRFSKSSLIAFLSSVFYLFSPIFIFAADSMTQIAYADFVRSAMLFSFIIMLDSEGKKKSLFLDIIWLLLVIEAFITFEYIVYMSIFFILYKYFYKISRAAFSIKDIIILLSASVFGFFIHFVQNVWYFGSVALAFNDLRDIAVTSIGSRADMSMSLNLGTWLEMVIARNFSLVFLFNYFILITFIAFSFFLYRSLSGETKERIRSLFKLTAIFIACGISWYIIFPSHSLAHTFIKFLARHLIPVSSLVFALVIYAALSFVREHNPKNLMAKVVCCILALGIVFAGVAQSQLPINRQNVSSSLDFLKFKEDLLSLKEMSDETDRIGVNYFRHPFIGFYTNRRTFSMFNKATLEGLERLPEYFIFFPQNRPDIQELGQYINEKYVLLYRSSSSRLPAIFYKLKNKEDT